MSEECWLRYADCGRTLLDGRAEGDVQHLVCGLQELRTGDVTEGAKCPLVCHLRVIGA